MMKLTLIRKDKKNQTHITHKGIEWLMARIATDTKTEDVQNLRRCLASPESKLFVENYAGKLHRICPSAELDRDVNGNMVVRAVNGIVMLTVRNVLGREAQERVKQLVGQMPTTLAAFVGSSGRSVKVLVRVERSDGTVPQTEQAANEFLQVAFDFVVAPYQALVSNNPIDRQPVTAQAGFRMTLDEHPLYHPAATAFKISAAAPVETATPSDSVVLSPDYDLYMEYEQLYQQALKNTGDLAGDDGDRHAFFAELARQMSHLGIPVEEAFTHIWQHHKYNPPLPEQRLRAIVEAAYAEAKPNRRKQNPTVQVGRETQDLIRFMENRYVFRYNTVMGYTEYRPNNTWIVDWQPVDERVINGITTDARLSGLNVWDRDVKRYVKSDKVRNFDPISDYLWRVRSKWDGQDHIGRLAATVPTDNPHWPRWFRTWLLAMVAQWQGRSRRYGNSVAPLLISSQGYNKSTFCRMLLPEELQWGYTDNLSLDEKRPVLQAMSQMLLINLDEFNQISARTQEGFLKNVIQLARVKARRPYGQHVEEFPRLASFIATTNMSDVLADPTGNRRFIGVELTGPIDVSLLPNHEQIYAQAQALIDQGEPYWFDDRETQLIMRHNRQFQLKSPAEQYFGELFAVAAEDDPEGQWLTAAAIFQRIRKVGGSALKQSNIVAFGRMLTNLEGMLRHRTVNGTEYWVRQR